MSGFNLLFRRSITRVAWAGVLGLLGSFGCSSSESNGGGGPEEFALALSNVNSIPGLEIDLKDGAGADKGWRVGGGSETTGPISLGLTPGTVTVLVEMDDDEELRITARQGVEAGSEKSCRRANGAGAAGSDVKVSDLDDVRCTGDKWKTPDPQPVSDCLSPVILSDDFTSGTQWTATQTTGSGSTHTVAINASGGNPGGYRHMTHDVPAPDNVTVNHFYTGGTYDPSVSGAIRYMHYSEDRIQFNPPFGGAAIGASFLVSQGGGVFIAFVTGGQYTTQVWQTDGIRRVVPADFANPGLNYSGGLMTFGFLRTNTNISTTTPFTTTHGIDNWTVVICH